MRQGEKKILIFLHCEVSTKNVLIRVDRYPKGASSNPARVNTRFWHRLQQCKNIMKCSLHVSLKMILKLKIDDKNERQKYCLFQLKKKIQETKHIINSY